MNEVAHLLGLENADGDLGQLAAGQEGEIRHVGVLDAILHLHVVHEHVGQADFVGKAEPLVQRRPAHVRVHTEHFIAVLRANHRQIEKCGGLALAGAGADDRDAVGLRILLAKFDVGTQHAISFGVRRILADRGKHFDVLRNHSQHGQSQIALDIVNGLHTGVEILDEECQHHAQHEAGNGGQPEVKRHVRFDRRSRRPGLINDFHGRARHLDADGLLIDARLDGVTHGDLEFKFLLRIVEGNVFGRLPLDGRGVGGAQFALHRLDFCPVHFIADDQPLAHDVDGFIELLIQFLLGGDRILNNGVFRAVGLQQFYQLEFCRLQRVLKIGNGRIPDDGRRRALQFSVGQFLDLVVARLLHQHLDHGRATVPMKALDGFVV